MHARGGGMDERDMCSAVVLSGKMRLDEAYLAAASGDKGVISACLDDD